MLSRIVNIINRSERRIESGTLFCNNYIVADKECLGYLAEHECFEQLIYIEDLNDGEPVNLELSLHKLALLDFYDSFESFFFKNKYYVEPQNEYYIYDIKCSNTTPNELICKHVTVINLINAIKNIAKHSYVDADIENSIIFREDKTVFLPFEYDSQDILSMDIEIDKLNATSNILKGVDSEKKFLFINELINFLEKIDESNRFKFLLSNFQEFYDKCNNAYQFYLRDFSYNKLKIELDSKALEYTQKIQSVINEAQTKLIAIPTVFVLAFTTFDYSELLTIKNIVTILSLFIFAVIIQLFLNNQQSTLNFIQDNINSYKSTFRYDNIAKITSRFSLVEFELTKQRNRLLIVEVILWLIPIVLLCLWLVLFGFSITSYVISFLFIFITVFKIFI